MRRYYLGLAAGYTRFQRLHHTFAVGRQKDCDDLGAFLSKRYGGKAILCKNGRSALAMALRAYLEPGEAVIVNGFTCYAVYEAVRAAKLIPVWADIEKESLNFNLETLKKAVERSGDLRVRGVIVQNSLGNPVDMVATEMFAKKHSLVIIEDLAHATGVRYSDGREAGTVGAAAVFSFGKDKSIDTVSGGAVVFRDPCKRGIQAPSRAPKPSDHLRARFYPVFGAMCRGLTGVHLGGILMKCLLELHLVERSADNKLDLERRPSKFEAKMALMQFKKLKKSGEPVLREHCFVHDRSEALAKLKQSGYYFDGFWYEKPVSPKRYYKKVRFSEADCPEAVWAAEHILNLPNYYAKSELTEARKIISEYAEERNE